MVTQTYLWLCKVPPIVMCFGGKLQHSCGTSPISQTGANIAATEQCEAVQCTVYGIAVPNGLKGSTL